MHYRCLGKKEWVYVYHMEGKKLMSIEKYMLIEW